MHIWEKYLFLPETFLLQNESMKCSRLQTEPITSCIAYRHVQERAISSNAERSFTYKSPTAGSIHTYKYEYRIFLWQQIKHSIGNMTESLINSNISFCSRKSSSHLTYLIADTALLNTQQIKEARTYLTVWISQEALQRDEYFWYGECQTPIVLNGINTNVSMTRHIWVEDACQETHYWWTHRVTVWNLQVQVEESTLIRAANRTCYGCLPVTTFLIERSSFYTFRGIGTQTWSKIILNSLRKPKIYYHVSLQITRTTARPSDNHFNLLKLQTDTITLFNLNVPNTLQFSTTNLT